MACIGAAGEQLVRYASIVSDAAFMNARTGVGAVMGSKKLKAVAVRGSWEVTAADPDTVLTALSAESATGTSARVIKKFEKLVMTFPDQWYEWRKFHMMRAGVA